MNKTHLKRYAPQARKDFIATVTGRAQLLGLSRGTGANAGTVVAEPCTVQGDVALIAGRAWPARVLGQRDALLQRMRRDGYFATLEAVAYTCSTAWLRCASWSCTTTWAMAGAC